MPMSRSRRSLQGKPSPKRVSAPRKRNCAEAGKVRPLAGLRAAEQGGDLRCHALEQVREQPDGDCEEAVDAFGPSPGPAPPGPRPEMLRPGRGRRTVGRGRAQDGHEADDVRTAVPGVPRRDGAPGDPVEAAREAEAGIGHGVRDDIDVDAAAGRDASTSGRPTSLGSSIPAQCRETGIRGFHPGINQVAHDACWKFGLTGSLSLRSSL